MCTQDKLNSVLSFVQSNELIRLVAKSLELAIILIDSDYLLYISLVDV